MKTLMCRLFMAAVTALVIAVQNVVPANATGTVVVQQRNGAQKTYTKVRIFIGDESITIVSEN